MLVLPDCEAADRLIEGVCCCATCGIDPSINRSQLAGGAAEPHSQSDPWGVDASIMRAVPQRGGGATFCSPAPPTAAGTNTPSSRESSGAGGYIRPAALIREGIKQISAIDPDPDLMEAGGRMTNKEGGRLKGEAGRVGGRDQ